MRNPSKVSATRIVKLGISATVFVISKIGTLMSRLVGRKAQPACVVLYYHSVPADQRALFAKQLDCILRFAKPVTFGDEVKLPGDEASVSVTFDDGFDDFFQNALPELQKRNLPAIMFVISGALGKAFGSADRVDKVMSAEQLQSLPSLITIGSHTVTHPFLPSISEEKAMRELMDSRIELEGLLGKRIGLFSFPFGGFNERLIELCRQAGYDRIFTTLPYFATGDPAEFVVGRVRVDPTDWPLEFRLKIAGAYRWLPWAFRWKRRIMTAVNGKASRHEDVRVRRGPQSMIREWGG